MRVIWRFALFGGVMLNCADSKFTGVSCLRIGMVRVPGQQIGLAAGNPEV